MLDTLRKCWIWIAVAALLLVALFGFGLWGRFHYWLYFGTGEAATKTQAISAAVQAITAAVIVALTAYYGRLSKRALDAANVQATAAQRQFDLAQKQFQAQYLPHLDVSVWIPVNNTNYIYYHYANVGATTVRINSLTVHIRTASQQASLRDEEFNGKLLAPSSPGKAPTTGRLELPAIIRDAVLAERQPYNLNEGLRLEIIAGDVAGLLTYRCVLDSDTKSYTVTVIS